jgi:hypothetical protein
MTYGPHAMAGLTELELKKTNAKKAIDYSTFPYVSTR